MKSLLMTMVFFILLCLVPCTAMTSESPASQWSNLLEVSYRFSWYPKSDLQGLLAEKGAEYHQTLVAYRDALQEELGIRSGEGGRFEAVSQGGGMAWKKYYSLSLAEFSLFLVADNPLNLDNAQAAMAVLSGKSEQADVAFWQHLFSAYQELEKGDRSAFISAVYDLWQNVVLKLEVDDLRMEDPLAKAGFVKSLPYLYENLAQLIIRRAIVEKKMAGLSPLGVIILSIEKRLSVENGYRTVVEATVERMRGLNSDNYNLNFAVAFLEATANRHDFEEEKDPANLVPRFNQAEKFYLLAFDWADSSKARMAVLTQHMGFLNYVTRRLVDPGDVLAREPFFAKVPAAAVRYLDRSMALYDTLAGPEVRSGGFDAEGFRLADNYRAAMHKLWDSSAKLAIMLGSYYKAQPHGNTLAALFPAESPLLKYCLFFGKHARRDMDIVPDNAYFLTAYAAGELAGLYREVDEYSVDSRAGKLFFGYQLQAVEILPLDVIGILELAYQANKDGRLEDYFLYTSRIGERLKKTETVRRWLENNNTEYNGIVAAIPTAVPQIMENAYPLVNFIQAAGGSEEGMYRKTLAMNQVLLAAGEAGDSDLSEKLLKAVGATDFTHGGIMLDGGLQRQIPLELAGRVNGALAETSGYQYARLKNELYASVNSPVHGLLRRLFYEVPYEHHQYPDLVESVAGTLK
jgi:hypothetical protein